MVLLNIGMYLAIAGGDPHRINELLKVLENNGMEIVYALSLGDLNDVRGYISGLKRAEKQTIFIRGCVEDYNLLKHFKYRYIDPYQRLFYLYGGPKVIKLEDELFVLAGIGGKELDRKEKRLILPLKDGLVDILLSHSKLPEDLLSLLKPRYYFYFSHKGEPPRYYGTTISVDLSVNSEGLLRLDGSSVGLLEVKTLRFFLLSKTYELVPLTEVVKGN